MTLTVYGDRISGNCLKVKWVADRLALAYRWVDIDFYELTCSPLDEAKVNSRSSQLV